MAKDALPVTSNEIRKNWLQSLLHPFSNRRKKELEELRAAKTAAEEAIKSKTNFMAKVSHDLRSPLNAIIGFAELMYQEKVGEISNEHKEYLGDILTSARQLLVLINDVIDLAKLEAGKMEFHPEKIDFKKVLSETRSVFNELIKTKNIQFEIELDPMLEQIIIDPARLKQVIYNYVSNALKCTPEGGHVTIKAHPQTKGFFRLEVIDNGIGIRPDDLNKLFIEFQQLDRNIARKYPSSGLGLALTKYIVKAQGGEVGAQSEFGKGSTFYAILPAMSALQADLKEREAHG